MKSTTKTHQSSEDLSLREEKFCHEELQVTALSIKERLLCLSRDQDILRFCRIRKTRKIMGCRSWNIYFSPGSLLIRESVMDYMNRYELWTQSDYFDTDTKMELASLCGNNVEIKERFHKDLEFGTSGLRGIMGAGTNRVNKYTVRKAAQGFANYLKKLDSEKSHGILIAYDSRKNSKEFALETALVMCASGVKAYVFESLRPTPELSFGIRHLGLSGGVVITASHNPAEYNGFKVYGADGGQVTHPADRQIIDEVSKIGDWHLIARMDLENAIKNGMLVYVGEDVDEAYYEAVLAQSVDECAILEQSSSLNIVYTPLHGSGNVPVCEVLSRAGFMNVYVVAEQEEPNGNFPTVEVPNPEDLRVFDLALVLADEVDADIIIATDPDADRIGVAVCDKFNKYIFLNGNMIGVLLVEYILSRSKRKGQLPKDGIIISSVVSTKLTRKISEHYGVKYEEVLTGFKYISEKIEKMDKEKDGTFIFGFEESFGYLAGNYIRDKDAVLGAYLVCEMAAHYKTRSMTLCDGLNEIYEKYGYYLEETVSVTFEGIKGSAVMERVMDSYRAESPAHLGDNKVVEISDFKTGLCTNLVSGRVGAIDMAKSNVLYYECADGSWMCIRPSGTEPKIKLYFGTNAKTMDECKERLEMIIVQAFASFESRRRRYG